MYLLPHLQCKAGQIAERVVLCGDPARVDRIAQQLEQAEVLGQHREFRLINGHYQGHPITVCSTGIGGASTVIALEELVQAGARSLIRVGSAGALQQEIGLGDLIVVEGAVRNEGASQAYLPTEYPACADIWLQAALLNHIATSGQVYWHGLVRSHDSFYRDDEQEVCRYWHARGVLGADMESASLLAVGRLRKVRVAAVLCNVVPFEQDVQQGVADYASAEQAMMAGECSAIAAALHALVS
ncbi:nucleoside phosphorylase [Aeromonas cavernicola]|uniref:Uridine phosphorylase n=1 Tax=Aeromonas cavernicola TaxID=1006623 RepID=A0A2H9U5P8_9GAMM|nr:nucleoside phosphorylase [Aeromonas cavernicola]PJG59288.1 uridine phosphorylase [Aeromonas cavernicola]